MEPKNNIEQIQNIRKQINEIGKQPHTTTWKHYAVSVIPAAVVVGVLAAAAIATGIVVAPLAIGAMAAIAAGVIGVAGVAGAHWMSRSVTVLNPLLQNLSESLEQLEKNGADSAVITQVDKQQLQNEVQQINQESIDLNRSHAPEKHGNEENELTEELHQANNRIAELEAAFNKKNNNSLMKAVMEHELKSNKEAENQIENLKSELINREELVQNLQKELSKAQERDNGWTIHFQRIEAECERYKHELEKINCQVNTLNNTIGKQNGRHDELLNHISMILPYIKKPETFGYEHLDTAQKHLEDALNERKKANNVSPWTTLFNRFS